MTQVQWLSSGVRTPIASVHGTPGQLGNPDASVGFSIGVGGLLLTVLAAYGIYRLAKG